MRDKRELHHNRPSVLAARAAPREDGALVT